LRAAARRVNYGGIGVRDNSRQGDMQDDIKTALTAFRNSIDNLDAAMIYLMAERFKLTQKVGEFKRDHDLPPADPGREEKQIARLRSLAQQSHLDPDFAERLLRFIIDEVIHNHERIRKA
jgi:chorismate mutase